ncbi:MAG: Ig-like domain-containing protein [Eubacterium sp.]|nr:Ig-like domain-containing protein [Eubacterium sp.]
MRVSIKRTVKKMAAVSLAVAMALSVSPAVKSEAKVKKPVINYKGTTAKEVQIIKDTKADLIVKKGSYKIKSVKWSSSNKKIATVKKYDKVTGRVTGKDYGSAKITAKVTTKKTKKKNKVYTLKAKVLIIEDPESDEPEDMPIDEWVDFAGSPEIDDGYAALLAGAYQEVVGVEYEAVCRLGVKRTSDGISYYRFLVKLRATTAHPTTNYAVVQISENGDVVKLEDCVETDEGKFSIPTEEIVVGGFEEFPRDEMVITKPEANLLRDQLIAQSNYVEGTEYTPIAKIAKQLLSDGSYKLRVIIEERYTLGEESNPKYIISDVTIDKDYNFTIDPAATQTLAFTAKDA